MYLVLCWLVTHNKFEAGWPWCGMTGRSSSCGTTGKQDPSWALLLSRQKWGNERMEPGRPPVTERPGQTHRAQPLRTSSAAEFSTRFYNEHNHLPGTHYVPASVRESPIQQAESSKLPPGITSRVLFFPFPF